MLLFLANFIRIAIITQFYRRNKLNITITFLSSSISIYEILSFNSRMFILEDILSIQRTGFASPYPLNQTLFMKQVTTDVNLNKALLILLKILKTNRAFLSLQRLIVLPFGQTMADFGVDSVLLPANHDLSGQQKYGRYDQSNNRIHINQKVNVEKG